MAFTKTGSPSTILKVAEVEKKNEKEAQLKVLADRPEVPTPPVAQEGEGDDGDKKIGGTD